MNEKSEKRVEVILGWKCNNNCIFCSEQESRIIEKQKPNYFNHSTEYIIDVIDNYKSRGYSEITFLGGEPTIRKDFLDIVKKTKQIGFNKISITTNARMFSDKKFLQKSLDAGITEIGVSIHGHNSNIQDSLTRTPHSFKQTVLGLKNVNMMIDNNFTSFVINKLNYKYLKEMYDFLTKMNIKNQLYSFLCPPDNFSLNKIITPYYSDMKYYLLDMLKNVRKDQMIKVANVPLCIMTEKNITFKEEFTWKHVQRRTIHKQNITNCEEKNRIDSSKKKYEHCCDCHYYDICEGIWENYERKNLDEFHPIIKQSK